MSKLEALVNSDNIQSIVITLRLFYHGNEVKVPVPLAEHEADPGHDGQAQLDPGVPEHVHEGDPGCAPEAVPAHPTPVHVDPLGDAHVHHEDVHGVILDVRHHPQPVQRPALGDKQRKENLR